MKLTIQSALKLTPKELKDQQDDAILACIAHVQKISNSGFQLHVHSFAPSADFCALLERLAPLPQHFVERYELWTEQTTLAYSSSSLTRIALSMGLFSLLLTRSGVQDLQANWHHLAAALPLAIGSLALIPKGYAFWNRSMSALQKTANEW